MKKPNCDPQDIAIKSFFLGPQAENSSWFKEQWIQILDRWILWRKSLFPKDGQAISIDDQTQPEFKALQDRTSQSVDLLLKKLEAELPKFTPRYMGHMIAEASLPALIGHVATLLHNPNMTTRESSKVTSDLETEAIGELAKMVGFPNSAIGHFTGGGTVANIEALWRARYRFDNFFALALKRKSTKIHDDFFSQCHIDHDTFLTQKKQFLESEVMDHSFVKNGPWKIQTLFQSLYKKPFEGPIVFVPGNKHFSWQKAVSLLGLGDSAFWSIAIDKNGKLSVPDLKNKIEKARAESRPILMVVSVLGTTELGTVDPIEEIQNLLDFYKKEQGL
nr:pyridoxal-dependent decarboxylase [Pseudobdellovibrionaceae bacterium]